MRPSCEKEENLHFEKVYLEIAPKSAMLLNIKPLTRTSRNGQSNFLMLTTQDIWLQSWCLADPALSGLVMIKDKTVKNV